MITILVVDNEACVRDAVRLVLENRECRVLVASGGRAALDLATREHVDLILLDCRLQGMTAKQVLAQFRAAAATAAIPVVLMSRIQDAETEKNGHLRANGYLLKPIHPVALLNEIQQALTSAFSGQEDRAAA